MGGLTMLHTLNRAWAEILARQLKNGTIQKCLCVVGPDSEFDMLLDVMKKYQVHMKVLYVEEVTRCVEFQRHFNIGEETYPLLEDEMYDNILISHDLHNIFAKDYLSKHCRQKGG